MQPWFDRAFGAWYLKLYPHRDDTEAERALDTMGPWLPEGGRVLDVGTGGGRYLQILAARGWRCWGLDRSRTLLAEAARRQGLPGRLIRGDMRALPVGDRTLDAVISMFTSFGYFGSQTIHMRLLGEYARVTRKGGSLVLDAINPPWVRSRLVPESERSVDGVRVEERRRIESADGEEMVVKTMTLFGPDGDRVDAFEERVSLYERDRLEAMLTGAGWSPETAVGDYDGGAWSPDSPRLLVAARNAAP